MDVSGYKTGETVAAGLFMTPDDRRRLQAGDSIEMGQRENPRPCPDAPASPLRGPPLRPTVSLAARVMSSRRCYKLVSASR